MERFQQFLIATKIDEEECKRAIFQNKIGQSTYRILRNLVSPKKPEEETLVNLAKIMQSHFKPAPSEIVEHCKFHTRLRRPGESIATFVTELRSLSEFCNFGETFEDMIRDSLICGINDDAMQKHMLAEPKFTYKRAVELAQSLQWADKNVKELKPKINGTESSLGSATH